MKIGRLTIGWGRAKETAAVPEGETAAVKKSAGGWGSLWPLAMEWILFKDRSVTDPFAQNPQVYKAVSAIASNIPQAEIAFYNDSTGEEVEDQALSELFYRPNEYESWHDFLESVAGHFALRCEAFIVKEASIGQMVGTRKLPSSLWTDCPKKFKTITDQRTGGLIGWEYNKRILQLGDVIHIKSFNPNDRFRGTSPLDVMDGEIQLDFKAMMYNKRFLDNDATPSFVLSTDKNLTVEQRERLTAWAEKRNKGIENAGKMSIFDGGLKPEVLSKSHKDMEFSQQRDYAREEILGAWKTPKALFNITEQLNYATFTGQMKVFWLYTLVPIMRKIEEGINYGLVQPYNPNIYFAFKLDNIPAFQEDFYQKVTTAKTLFDMGFTANEINQKLGLGFDEKDWRDFWWVGFGVAPADADGARENRDTTMNADPANDPTKAVNKDVSLMSLKTWRAFVAKQNPNENRMKSRMNDYFFTLKAEVLKAIAGGAKDAATIVNWGAKDEELKKIAAPIIRQSLVDGIEVGRDLVGRKGVVEEALAAKVEGLVAVKADKIKGTNRTTQENIRRALEEGIKNGGTVADLADAVRASFSRFAKYRAQRIARTETVGALNAGSNLYYAEAGIKKKRWVTAGDELVRESHRAVDGEVQDPEDRFTNGMAYPGDQDINDAGEVCNCRCTISPVV